MHGQIKQLQVLGDRLDEIEKFIEMIEVQKRLCVEYNRLQNKSEIPLENMEELLTSFNDLTNSVVNYTAIVVSIYACFENFIHELIKSYIEFQHNNINSFCEFNEKMRENYFKQAGEYLSNPSRYSRLEKTSEEVITCLFQNIKHKPEVSIEYEFFLNNSGNLKFKKVKELFLNIGISNLESDIKRNFIFKKYISNHEGIKYGEVEEYLNRVKQPFLKLDQLVDHRNNVAHKWYEDQRISLQSILNEYIPFIRSLANVLLEITLCKSYLLLKKNGKLEKFDSAIKVISDQILCINSKSSFLKLKDYIFYEDSLDNTFVAMVESLQINHDSVEKSDDVDIEIGIGLNHRIKDSYKFYYKKTEKK